MSSYLNRVHQKGMVSPVVASRLALLIIAGSILLPVVPIGNRLEGYEPFIYFAVLLLFSLNRPKLERIQWFAVGFLLLFLGIQIMSVMLGMWYGRPEVVYGSDDFMKFRLAMQLSCSFVLFYWLGSCVIVDDIVFRRMLLYSILILIIPCIVTFFQYWDIGGARDFITDVYGTVFLSESRFVRGEYRFASVFKDHYSAGIYFAWVSLFACYLIFRKIFTVGSVLTVSVVLCYIALFMTLRTGLVIVPFGLLIMAAISSFGNVRKFIQVIANTLCIGLLIIIGVYVAIITNSASFEWALRLSYIFEPVNYIYNLPSLYATMIGNKMTIEALLGDNSLFFFPAQLNTDEIGFLSGAKMGLFLDSYYLGTIYCYGIYMVIAYFFIIVSFIREGLKTDNYFIVALAICSVIISMKGASGLFLTKVVVVLGYMLAMSILIARRNKPDKSHKER